MTDKIYRMSNMRIPRTANTMPRAIFAAITFFYEHFAIRNASLVPEKMTKTATSGAINARL